jgi:hypothetical protein
VAGFRSLSHCPPTTLTLASRRKKTRCSGERPTCAFCVRLGQKCDYASGSSAVPGRSLSSEGGNIGVHAAQNVCHPISLPSLHGANVSMQADLAARVALLESRLGLQDKEVTQYVDALPQLFIALNHPSAPTQAMMVSQCRRGSQ